MIKGWITFLLITFLACPLLAQSGGQMGNDDLSGEEILLKQAQGKPDRQSMSQKLNDQMQALHGLPRTAADYILGPGDVIELSVEGIPGLDGKAFALDSQGKISVPYLGEVALMGLTTRDSEAKLVQLFSVSLLEDPQVTIAIKEYRSQFYYVMGAVHKPGKYSMSEATDILDALSLAGGLTDSADATIRLYRYPEQNPNGKSADANAPIEVSDTFASSNLVEINLPELLERARSNNRMAILSGDVLEVLERKEKKYYVLGDVVKPGPFIMNQDEPMVLSRALGSAGGMLKTASGNKVVILRQENPREVASRINVNAYAVLKGKTKDTELMDNDIVLVPGSASKTLGKSFLSNVSNLFTTLLIIGTR